MVRKNAKTDGKRAALLAGAVVIVALATLGPAAAVHARLVLPRDADASASLRALEHFWRAEDYAALSSLIATDGARISLGPVPERENLYSPSQAFYFFKNLFQALESEVFAVETSQADADDQVHAVVRWGYRRSGDGKTEGMRLVISLVRGPEGWAVTEIRALR
jgi:hypothetical protein